MTAPIFNMSRMNCLRCDELMKSLGQLDLRSGGKTGVDLFMRGILAEMSERLVSLDVYRCPKCGHLEFFDFDLSLPES